MLSLNGSFDRLMTILLIHPPPPLLLVVVVVDEREGKQMGYPSQPVRPLG